MNTALGAPLALTMTMTSLMTSLRSYVTIDRIALEPFYDMLLVPNFMVKAP